MEETASMNSSKKLSYSGPLTLLCRSPMYNGSLSNSYLKKVIRDIEITKGKLFICSKPQFPHLYNKDRNGNKILPN